MSTIKRCFILDRSGSMYNIVDDTIGGFNSFIESQKTNGGTMSLYLFDNEFTTVYEDMQITNVVPLTHETFVPRGSTALLDAIGNVIKKLVVSETPKDTLVKIIIMTDGYENSSKKYTSEYIKNSIEKYTKIGWDFMYLGANQDSILEASKLGIQCENTLDFDSETVQDVMRTVSITMTQQLSGNNTSLRQCSDAYSANL